MEFCYTLDAPRPCKSSHAYVTSRRLHCPGQRNAVQTPDGSASQGLLKSSPHPIPWQLISVTITITSTPYLTHSMQHRARPPLWGQFITISNLQTQYPTHHRHRAEWQINKIPLQTRAHLWKPTLAQPVKKKKKIPAFLWHTKVPNRAHKSLPLHSALFQIHQYLIAQSHIPRSISVLYYLSLGTSNCLAPSCVQTRIFFICSQWSTQGHGYILINYWSF